MASGQPLTLWPPWAQGLFASKAAVIYLHWTATGYDWIRPGHYHSIIGGDGRVHRLHAYSVDLPAHTYGRNRNSVALSCACMGGSPDPWTLPPTPAQLDSLCVETAAIARNQGWSADAISIQSVMTHAEAASNRDGRVMHDNDGSVIWGGPTTGGEQLRARICALLAGDASAPGFAADSPVAKQEPLGFGGFSAIQARGDPLTVQASVGWPLVEMTLQSGSAPVVLTGILRPSEDGDHAWCRVHEFAEEFGISVAYEPLVLGERRGG